MRNGKSHRGKGSLGVPTAQAATWTSHEGAVSSLPLSASISSAVETGMIKQLTGLWRGLNVVNTG